MCNRPQNLEVSSQTSSSVSLSWDAVSGATGYKLYYTKEGEPGQSPDHTTTNTNYTFNNLSTGRYSFYVETICDETSSTATIIVVDVTEV